jgi:ketosteroid isomerase-like protein
MRLTGFGLAPFAALLVLAAPLSAHERATSAGPSAALSPAARGAATTVDAFHAALERGDTRAAAALVADDALIFEAGGAELSKAEYAAHHLPADAEFSRGVSSVVTRRAGRADGTLAWIATEGRATGTYKGKPLDLLTTETMVLRRAGGSWKIVHIHWSSAKR